MVMYRSPALRLACPNGDDPRLMFERLSSHVAGQAEKVSADGTLGDSQHPFFWRAFRTERQSSSRIPNLALRACTIPVIYLEYSDRVFRSATTKSKSASSIAARGN